VGAFTPEGTFDAIIPRLDEMKRLGITAVELMPVVQFPGERNWGYDGVYPFAVQNSYGGPNALKRLVEACHQHGLALVVDVVYNHLGPEGNYLADFAPYFTDRYKTPWGVAVNFDGPHNDEVRRFFIESALRWITEFHIDALRIDAVHAIFDFSATPFLAELGSAVHERADQLGRQVYLIPESDLNDTRLLRGRDRGGFELDAQWSDDFHHALHALLTGEQMGYYQDFGSVGHLAKAFREGFVYSGEYSSYRRCRHGNSSRDIPAHKFVVCAQNHDQVGNRMLGERLSELVSFEQVKLAAGVVLLAPFIPLLFMGEEYGETAPFPYFVSHSDPALIDAVRRGRREEFKAFRWSGEPPDPQSEGTFEHAKLNYALRAEGRHRILKDFYSELIEIRKSIQALRSLSKHRMEVQENEDVRIVTVRRWSDTDEVTAVFHFGEDGAAVNVGLIAGLWEKRLDSAETRWMGPGSLVPAQFVSDTAHAFTIPPYAVVLFVRTLES
jgi:maltooligosyltrehalose trehalohydrolase